MEGDKIPKYLLFFVWLLWLWNYIFEFSSKCSLEETSKRKKLNEFLLVLDVERVTSTLEDKLFGLFIWYCLLYMYDVLILCLWTN